MKLLTHLNLSNMTKEELQTLTIEQLKGMTEQALKTVTNEVLEKLNETEIEELPLEVKKKLNLNRKSIWCSAELWITLIISALVMSIMQSIMGK